jgi:DNA-binding transcriptional LysR family regulator
VRFSLRNDPLFLRTPRGVVPTVRATELAEPIAEILSRVRSVVGTAVPFDPAVSQRRFAIAMPDAVSVVLLPPLLASVHSVAPGVGFGIRQLLPGSAASAGGTAWDHALADLDAREIDIAVGPFHDVPARFVKRTLFAEGFVIASRCGHPYALEPGLRRFCEAHHVLVSVTGQSQGFIDRLLLERGRARRIAVTVPSFMLALALVAETGPDRRAAEATRGTARAAVRYRRHEAATAGEQRSHRRRRNRGGAEG